MNLRKIVAGTVLAVAWLLIAICIGGSVRQSDGSREELGTDLMTGAGVIGACALLVWATRQFEDGGAGV